ncbi:MAG: ABC transporter ATP-binding protein [Nitrospinaceae bacterium]
MHLLTIDNLSTHFDTGDGLVQSVRNLDLHLDRGEMMALVGESGCGKSVTALSILRLIPTPPGRYASGRILLNGRNLFDLSGEEMRQVRGNEVGMIFQEPMTSLNPIFSIGDQITEAILQHLDLSTHQAGKLALEMLRKVAIPSPEQRMNQYPHELSGGMKQRVMIAMAIACQPALLIADEPTTALDVTIQAQILDLLDALRRETGMGVLLITHNLGIVAQYADRVAVMYSGKIVEEAGTVELFEGAAHPYTRGLLASLPREDSRGPLSSVPGVVPHPAYLPSGCAFHPRCAESKPECTRKIPPFFPSPQHGRKHQVACWLHEAAAPLHIPS